LGIIKGEIGLKTYLLTWTPSKSRWDSFAQDVKTLRSGRALAVKRWSCGNTRSIQKGNRFYFLRQGASLPGVIGSGEIRRAPYEGKHWNDSSKSALYVGIRIDTLANPEVDPYLPTPELRSGRMGSYHWLPYKSGTSVPDRLVPALDRLWRARTGSAKSAASSIAEIARRTVGGAGFGSPEENKRIERAAIRVATVHFERDGWRVRSVEADKVGYDLHCDRAGQILRAEVKGVRGTERRFILTAGEYRRARTDPEFALCVVTSVLRAPKVSVVTQRRLHDKLRVEPLSYFAELAK
jgi:hypothetical protein